MILRFHTLVDRLPEAFDSTVQPAHDVIASIGAQEFIDSYRKRIMMVYDDAMSWMPVERDSDSDGRGLVSPSPLRNQILSGTRETNSRFSPVIGSVNRSTRATNCSGWLKSS